jgi:hypothetical protein
MRNSNATILDYLRVGCVNLLIWHFIDVHFKPLEIVCMIITAMFLWELNDWLFPTSKSPNPWELDSYDE